MLIQYNLSFSTISHKNITHGQTLHMVFIHITTETKLVHLKPGLLKIFIQLIPFFITTTSIMKSLLQRAIFLSWTQAFYTKISECWLQYQKLKISHLKSLLVIHNITKMGFLSQKSFSHLPSLQSSTFKLQDLKYSHIKNGLQLLQFIFSSLHSPHL